MIGMLTGLQDRLLHIVRFQDGFHGHVLILIGLNGLPVQLIASGADGMLHRMGQGTGLLRLCFLKLQPECFLLRVRC